MSLNFLFVAENCKNLTETQVLVFKCFDIPYMGSMGMIQYDDRPIYPDGEDISYQRWSRSDE